MSRIHRSDLARVGTLLVSAVLIAACNAQSPRPDTTATPPPTPPGVTPIGQVTWTTRALPPGVGGESAFYGAASNTSGYVIVGDSGALGFHGSVLRSTDGLDWKRIDDPDIAPWSLAPVIATEAGFLAVGGHFSDVRADGSTGWISAILTTPDGDDWTVRDSFDGVSIGSVAARGNLVVATTDQKALLVSRDTGKTWTEVSASDVGFGANSPSVIAVLADGRWVALGTADTSAAAWTSADGLRWEPATIEAADPVAGIRSVTPGSIAISVSGAVAIGTDDPEACAEDDDFCGHYGAGWSTADGRHWMRLPKGTPLTDGWGGGLWSAGEAGVVAGPELRQSANGWSWSEVPGSPPGMLNSVLTRRGDTLVAAGLGKSDKSDDAPVMSIWTGEIANK